MTVASALHELDQKTAKVSGVCKLRRLMSIRVMPATESYGYIDTETTRCVILIFSAMKP